MAVRRQQVAEQLDVEGVVLDNQDLGQAIPPQNDVYKIGDVESDHK
jgi:hypothetical protein